VWCYEIAGREENEEVLIEDSNCNHLNSESQVNKIYKFKRQKGHLLNKKNDFLW